ncbi:MAG: hypothetical protein ABIQ95_09170, partial [Bdellovibrionia bacterium]
MRNVSEPFSIRIRFRTKLLGILGVVTIAFACSTVLQGILSARSRSEVGTIQRRYIPQIELSLRLDAELAHLRRAFQDSVSAQDREALARTNDSKKYILRLISSGE